MTCSAAEPCDLDISCALKAIFSRDLSSSELVESVLARARRTEGELHAYVELFDESARDQAETVDDSLRAGRKPGPLHGIPIAIKDIFDVEGIPTRCGSNVRSQANPAFADSDPVQRLRLNGAVILGKTVAQEFAAGVVSHPARNPWDPDRIPGGSSGGSAAAVSVRSAMGALGSDTGGSIRIPAAACGVVGLKPTFGVLSIRGVYPLAWSLDTVGPIARTSADAALLYRVLAGLPAQHGLISPEPGQIRLGVSHSHFFEDLQPGVFAALRTALSIAAGAGIEVIDTPWDDAPAARAAGFIINRVETAAVHQTGVTTYPDLYGTELVERVQAAALFPATGYIRALRARTAMRDGIAALFATHHIDALVSPTAPATALSAGDLFARYPDGSNEPVSLAYTRMTMPFNLTGQPVLTIPCGFDELGLPVGLQIAGRPYDELRLCQIGSVLERLFVEQFGSGWTVPPTVRKANA